MLLFSVGNAHMQMCLKEGLKKGMNEVLFIPLATLQSSQCVFV